MGLGTGNPGCEEEARCEGALWMRGSALLIFAPHREATTGWGSARCGAELASCKLLGVKKGGWLTHGGVWIGGTTSTLEGRRFK